MRDMARRSQLFACLPLIAAALTLGTAQGAVAEVRQGLATYERPETRSLDNRAPEEERTRHLESLFVSYDRAAGTLTIKTRLFAAEKWGYELGRVEFEFGELCAEGYADDVSVSGTYAGTSERTWNDESGAEWTPNLWATLSIRGYEGEADGALTFDGGAFTASYSHPALRGLELRCVEVRGDGSDAIGSYEAFYLDGYAPLKLTDHRATTAFKANLKTRFGAYRSGYVKCAGVWRDDEAGTQIAGCMAHFRVGRTYHYLSSAARVANGDYRITFPRRPFHRTWTRKWRRASMKCLRTGAFKPLRGVLYSNAWGCDARMASEIYRGVTGWHGTGTGYFLGITRYHCRRRGRTYTCRNGVGDAFRWTPAR